MLPENPKTLESTMMQPAETGRIKPKCQLTTAAKEEASSKSNTTSTIKTISLRFDALQLRLEKIMPCFYLTKNWHEWSDEKLHSYGFTHVITIDRHIKERSYPSLDPGNNIPVDNHREEFAKQLRFGEEFKTIDLNFGEKTYLTTVLPNCYKAVKFIDKALSCDGTILVIDCNGGEQKCLTIIAAYLMYKKKYNFTDAFARLKVFYKKAHLDPFYVNQLYEYEPILQVQRSESKGNSCSRELHSAVLKRKELDDGYNEVLYLSSYAHFSSCNTHDDITME